MSTLSVFVTQLRGQVAIGRQERNGHVLPLDRPTSTGGTGLGFNGGHLMLLGWGSCFKSVLVAAAEAREIEITNVHLEISGELAQAPARFEGIRMAVSFDSAADEQQKQHLVELSERGCAVSNTLKRATEVTIELVGSPSAKPTP